MTKLNPTQHAIMRYLSRYNDELIVGDNAFKIWREKNPELYEQGIKNLMDLSEKCDVVFNGKYNKENVEREYRIDTKTQSMLVCQKDKIITYYQINFGEEFDEENNKNIFETVLRQRDILIQTKTILEESTKEKLETLDNKISDINQQIEEIRLKIKELELKKSNLKGESEILKIKSTSLENKIRKIEQKLVFATSTFIN